MRPPSILWFEKLFLSGCALGALQGYWATTTMQAIVANVPATQGGLALASSMAFNAFRIGIIVNLAFWFFIARCASNAARWLWVVITLIGLPSAIMGFVQNPLLPIGSLTPGYIALFVANCVLRLAALAMLFRPDAQAWFAARGNERSTT